MVSASSQWVVGLQVIIISFLALQFFEYFTLHLHFLISGNTRSYKFL